MRVPRHLYTVGYEGLTLQAFIRRLQESGVETVADVRELPLSRKRGFSKRALAEALAGHGIGYTHIPALGCPKAIRNQYKSDGNWARYTQGFTGHLAKQRTVVQDLTRISRATTTALLCFEADFNRCHRTFVARAAAGAGAPSIVHITAKTEIPEPARRAAA